MINGNRGHGCSCTEQEHTDFGLIRTHIREIARINFVTHIYQSSSRNCRR